MIKKKAKSKRVKKAPPKKTAKGKRAPRSKKELNPIELRKDIAKIVGSGAKKMTLAVMDQAMHGQLAPAKYLFEVAAIYPPATDGSQSTAEEDSLAQTLLHRLNIPLEPVKLDEEDEPATMVIPASGSGKTEPRVDDASGDAVKTGPGSVEKD